MKKLLKKYLHKRNQVKDVSDLLKAHMILDRSIKKLNKRSLFFKDQKKRDINHFIKLCHDIQKEVVMNLQKINVPSEYLSEARSLIINDLYDCQKLSDLLDDISRYLVHKDKTYFYFIPIPITAFSTAPTIVLGEISVGTLIISLLLYIGATFIF